MDDYSIRQANENDIDFLVEVIVEAEKSGTLNLSYSTLFGLTENEVRTLLANALYEDVDDCDLSFSGFLVADYKGKPVAALNAWVEAKNGMPSVNVKGNILSYLLPREALIKANNANHICSDLSTEYIPGSFWLGSAYVAEEHRGKLLLVRLFYEQVKMHPEAEGVFCQVFGNNKPSIQNFLLLKFDIKDHYISEKKEIKNYLPSDNKFIFYKKLKKNTLN